MKRGFPLFSLLLSVILIAPSCHSPAKVQKVESTAYKISSAGIPVDSSAESIIAPYRHKVVEVTKEVISYSPELLEKGRPESKLGNLVADACFNRAVSVYRAPDNRPIDFAFLNSGGLRSSIPIGNVTKGSVFEVMPFENELVVLTISSSTVIELANYIATKGGEPVSHFTMGIKDSIPVDVRIESSTIDSVKIYKVLTSDYLANGGDNCAFFSKALKREDLGIKVRDAIIDYVSSIDTLKVRQDKRIFKIDE